MLDDWVMPYVNNIGKKIRLNQSTSCSKNPGEALTFATKDIKQNQKPTLYVLICQNYEGINGMSMSDDSTSAYPAEAEVLLCEGCQIHVLAVDTEVEILKYKPLKFTVVHLFHAQ